MNVAFGAIADDFTGATDLAALLSRSGWPVSLRIGLPDEGDQLEAPFEIIALKIRNIAPQEAVSQALEALHWLRNAGAERFYWKYCSTFDSTARGNIGPVAEALMNEIGAAQTLYCPAFPENGRSIFMGHLFVGEEPLDESPMKDHPLTPMQDSSLMRLLTPQVKKPVGLANRLVVAKGAQALRARLKELEEGGFSHVIVDAVANDDMQVIAEAALDFPLITGGSALAMPIPKLLAKAGVLGEVKRGGEGQSVSLGQLVLSGSCSAMTRKQVAAFRDLAASFRLDPLDLAKNGEGTALEWLRQQPVELPKIIYATAEPDEVRQAQQQLGVARAGELVEGALAKLAAAAFDMGIRRFVVAGGESSGAVTQALGVRQLTIGQEIAPGVPWTFAVRNNEPLALALKSGNFGSEQFFALAFNALEAA